MSSIMINPKLMPGKDRCAPLQPDGIRALTRVKIMIHESQPDAPQSIIIKQHAFICLSFQSNCTVVKSGWHQIMPSRALTGQRSYCTDVDRDEHGGPWRSVSVVPLHWFGQWKAAGQNSKLVLGIKVVICAIRMSFRRRVFKFNRPFVRFNWPELKYSTGDRRAGSPSLASRPREGRKVCFSCGSKPCFIQVNATEWMTFNKQCCFVRTCQGKGQARWIYSSEWIIVKGEEVIFIKPC